MNQRRIKICFGKGEKWKKKKGNRCMQAWDKKDSYVSHKINFPFFLAPSYFYSLLALTGEGTSGLIILTDSCLWLCKPFSTLMYGGCRHSKIEVSLLYSFKKCSVTGSCSCLDPFWVKVPGQESNKPDCLEKEEKKERWVGGKQDETGYLSWIYLLCLFWFL